MKNIFKTTILVAAMLTVAACSGSHKVIQPKDAYALQEMQTRDFEAPFKITYASVLSVLQDNGYIVETADGVGGLITAKSPTSSSTSYSLLWGFGKEKKTTKITVFVEPIGAENSKARLNLLNVEVDSNIYGMSDQVDRPIEDPAMYSTFFEKVEEAIFIRQATQ